MTPPPTHPVSVADGEITVDAEVLAPKLGLSVGALKDNMARGLVTSVAESGVDEDAGRWRLTFRYRARVWRVVLEADGTLVDDPAPVGTLPARKDRFDLFDDLADFGRGQWKHLRGSR